MSMISPTPGASFRPQFVRAIQEDIQELRARWLWFVVLGIALIVLGLVALSYSLIATEMTMLVIGWMMLFGGAFFIVGSFYTGCWGGFFLSLLAGVLHLVVGFIVINHPLETAKAYTLFLAVFFFVEGLFRVITALSGRFRQWGWVLLNGVVTLLLGVLIWREWPYSGLWVVGTFVGIDLIIAGWSYVALGMHAKALPASLPA